MRPAPSRLIIDSIDFETASVSGTFSSSTTLTPGTSFERLDRHRMRLVPAEIVARADIDHADRQVLGGERAPDRAQVQRSAGQPKAVVFRSERREIVSAVIVILGRVALRRRGPRLLKLTAAKTVPSPRSCRCVGDCGALRLILSAPPPDC